MNHRPHFLSSCRIFNFITSRLRFHYNFFRASLAAVSLGSFFLSYIPFFIMGLEIGNIFQLDSSRVLLWKIQYSNFDELFSGATTLRRELQLVSYAHAYCL